MRVLVVEDDPKVARFLQSGLESERHVVDVARSRLDGVHLATSRDYEVVILDLVILGLEAIRDLRGRRPGTAIIGLSARADVDERIGVLEAGADDCLVKPFSFAELLARVRAIQRRLSKGQEVVSAGDLVVDLVRHRVLVHGSPVEFTTREYQLLEVLVRRASETLTRAVLADRVWGIDFDTGSNVIDVYVSYLRKKLAASGSACSIETVRGAGYRFQPSRALTREERRSDDARAS